MQHKNGHLPSREHHEISGVDSDWFFSFEDTQPADSSALDCKDDPQPVQHMTHAGRLALLRQHIDTPPFTD